MLERKELAGNWWQHFNNCDQCRFGALLCQTGYKMQDQHLFADPYAHYFWSRQVG